MKGETKKRLRGKAKLSGLSTILFLVIILIASDAKPALGWSNGGFSNDPTNPAYGTHDWIAQHALDRLPANEKQYIADNLAAYLYGTELPDNSNSSAPGHIGDTTKHTYTSGLMEHCRTTPQQHEPPQNSKRL
jgi:hypothetical protein